MINEQQADLELAGLACFSYSWRQPASLNGADAQALEVLSVSSPCIQCWVTPRIEVRAFADTGIRLLFALSVQRLISSQLNALPLAVGWV